MHRTLLLAAAVTVSAGCVHQASGLAVRSHEFKEASVSVRNLAAHDFGCEREQVETELVTADSYTPTSYSARGCGQEALYVRTWTGAWLRGSDPHAYAAPVEAGGPR